MAAVADSLAGANWQRGGGKGRRPKPIPRPGDEPERRLTKAHRLGGKKSLSIEEMRDLQRKWAAGENQPGRKHKTRRVR